MKTNYTLEEQWGLIKPIWRILVAVIAVQLIAGVGFIQLEKYAHPFIDFWFGAAFSTFPAFIVGFAWHMLSSESKFKSNMLAILFVGFLSIVMSIAATLMTLGDFAFALPK